MEQEQYEQYDPGENYLSKAVNKRQKNKHMIANDGEVKDENCHICGYPMDSHNIGCTLWIPKSAPLDKEQDKIKKAIEDAFVAGHKKGWLRGADGHNGWTKTDTTEYLESLTKEDKPKGD